MSTQNNSKPKKPMILRIAVLAIAGLMTLGAIIMPFLY